MDTEWAAELDTNPRACTGHSEENKHNTTKPDNVVASPECLDALNSPSDNHLATV